MLTMIAEFCPTLLLYFVEATLGIFLKNDLKIG